MIDIKTLDNYTKFINLKQICLLSGLSYETVKTKVRRFRHKQNTSLTEEQSVKLSKALRKLGVTKIQRNIKN